MTILKGPHDPVILKKVSMKVWHLRDHLIAILNTRLENTGDIEKIKDIEDLKKEYSFEEKWLEPEEKVVEENVESEKNEGEPFTVVRRIVNVPEEKVANGQAILYEIDMNKIHFFCEQSFLIGSSIVLKLEVPKSLGIQGLVVDCRAFDLESKIIREINYPYRVVAEFQFIRPGQKSLLRQFLMAIDPRLRNKEAISEEVEEVEEEREEVEEEVTETEELEEKESA